MDQPSDHLGSGPAVGLVTFRTGVPNLHTMGHTQDPPSGKPTCRTIAVIALLIVGTAACGGSQPAGAGRTPGIQFRPVLAEHPCPSGTKAGTDRLGEQPPPPKRPVALPMADQGGCLSLGPAALVLKRAQGITDSNPGAEVLTVTLSAQDVGAFDQLAVRYYHHQVALIVGQEVLIAPQVDATSFHGTIQLSGLSGAARTQLASALGLSIKRLASPPAVPSLGCSPSGAPINPVSGVVSLRLVLRADSTRAEILRVAGSLQPTSSTTMVGGQRVPLMVEGLVGVGAIDCSTKVVTVFVQATITSQQRQVLDQYLLALPHVVRVEGLT